MSLRKSKSSILHESIVLFVLFVCLFVVFRPTREFFTHTETASMLGTYAH